MTILRKCLMLLTATFAGLAVGKPADGPPVTAARDFLSGTEDRPCTLEGNVLGAFFDPADEGFVFLLLDCDGDFVYAPVDTRDRNETVQMLLPLVNHRVRITGRPTEVLDLPYSRFVTRRLLHFNPPEDVRVIDGTSRRPFSSPDVDTSPPALNEIASCGARKTRGVVTARWQGNRILLQKANGYSIMVQFRDGIPLPERNAAIEVEGIPETDLYRINLTSATWRNSETKDCAAVAPVLLPLTELFRRGEHFIINGKHFGKLLTVRGTLKNFATDETGHRRPLIEADGLSIQIDCSEAPQALDRLRIGSFVSATGICVTDTDFWRPSAPFPRIKSIFLVARTPDDLVVLNGPPWWTPFRFVIVLCLMAGVLALILVWNLSLRILIDRRSREVIRAQTAKIESELRIDERTRLAAELHDNTVQNLTAIAYRITAAHGALGDRETEARQILQVAAKMLKSCRTSLRQCLWDLRNDALDEPDFATAIRRTVETVAGDAKLSVRFSGRRDLINDTTAHAILNILRELVSNAIVHGDADSVSIAGEARQGSIRFSVSDNGTGFDPTSRPGQDDGHFGLDGIQERLDGLGGAIDIDSSAGKGTNVRITIHKT